MPHRAARPLSESSSGKAVEASKPSCYDAAAKMEAHSTVTATLAIWTIARAAAVAVLATETLFIWFRRKGTTEAPAATSRIFWALTPALLLAGLCFWCTASVSARRAAGPATAVAQLAR
jgi:Na+-transporting NADH:ubiquinone oxidoreductase subunit NqrB